MTAPWIDEGIRQLRLAVLWACSVKPQTQPEAAERARELFQRVREEVINRSLAQEWIPGIAEQIRRLQRHLRDLRPRDPAETAGKLIDRIEARFRSAFDGSPPAQPVSTESLRLALQFAVDAALDQVGVGTGTAGWGNLGNPAALQPSAQIQAAAWLSEGAALIAWEPLEREIDARASTEVNLRRMPAVANDCNRLLDWLGRDLADRTARGPVPARLRKAVEEATSLLGDCSETLGRLRNEWPDDEGPAARDPESTLKIIADEIQRGAKPWPPRLLLEFQKTIRQRDEGRFGTIVHDASVRTLPDDDASGPHLILLALADRLASLNLGADHPAWDDLERLGRRLVDDPAESIEIVRVPRSGLARRDEVLDDGQPPRVVTPGLVVLKGAEQRVIRRGRIETARRQADAPALCRRLATALQSRSPELAEPFERIADDLAARPDLASAWSIIQADPESLGRFWQGVQRASALAIEHVPAAADFLAELGRTFQFVEPSGKGPSRDGWRIARDGNAREAGPLSGVPQLALRGPDGVVVEPAQWLRIPAQWDTPLLRALETIQPLIGGLRALDPNWEGWAIADALPWNLAYRGEADQPASIDSEAARDAFEAAYARSQRVDDPLANAFQKLARALHAGLVDSGVGFSPELDRESLRPRKVTPGTLIRWVTGSDPAGTLLRVARFGVGDLPGEVEMSLGPDPSPEVRGWAEWLARGSSSEIPGLDQWRSVLPELLAQPETLRARSQELGERFRRWARSEEGGETFDQLVAANDGPARTLIDAIEAAGWAELWPRTDADGRAVWPEGIGSRAIPGAVWGVLPGVPFGRSPAGRFRSAIAPELIRGDFSLGDLPPESSIAAALGLVRAADRGGPGLAKTAFDIAHDEIDATIGLTGIPGPSTNLATLLDAIVGAARSRSTAVEILDEILDAGRRWAGAHGLAILPQSWSFTQPPDPGRLASEGLNVTETRFLEGSEVGQVRLGVLGFSGDSGRPPALVISAGPPPTHFAELCKQVRDAEDDWSEAGRLSEDLLEWPTARIDGEDSLRFAAERFFGTFWDLAGPPPRSSLIDEIGRTLSRLLAENFDLTTFEPVSLRDFGRDWVTVNEYGPDKSHRVKRLIRPGLRTPTDVSYPAVVDVE